MKEQHDVHARMKKFRHWLRLDKMPKTVRVVVVGVVGGILFVAGLIMIVTPGPAFIFIPLGLFLLASEFKWAERWAQKLANGFDKVRAKWRQYRRKPAAAKS